MRVPKKRVATATAAGGKSNSNIVAVTAAALATKIRSRTIGSTAIDTVYDIRESTIIVRPA